MSKHVVKQMEMFQERMTIVQNRKGGNWMNKYLSQKE